MNPEQPSSIREWYKKKRYIIPITAFALFTGIGLFADDPAPSSQVKEANVQQATLSQPEAVTPITEPKVESATIPDTESQQVSQPKQDTTELSNNNYYKNVDGNQVHSPAYTNDDAIPAGASALCGDGTYSFSQNRRGTCSRHGGVAQWY